MKVYTVGFEDSDYGIIDSFSNKWNPAYYKCPREIPDEIWNEYETLRKRFFELHDLIEERFEESYDEELDGKA